MTENEIFTCIFNKARPIPFNRAWSNGTGYFNYATDSDEAPVVGAGAVVSSTAPGGRRILIVGTKLGNVVVFQRYDNRDDLFVCHAPTVLLMAFSIVSEDKLSVSNLITLLGDGMLKQNIGIRINDILKAAKFEQQLAA